MSDGVLLGIFASFVLIGVVSISYYILPGTSQKFQKKVAQAVKRARHLAILPFVTDCMK